MMVDELNTVPELPETDEAAPEIEADTDAPVTEAETAPESEETEAAADVTEEKTEEAATETEAASEENTTENTEETVEEEKPEPKPDYLTMTLESHVLPLEMRFSQINNCYKKLPFAYRSYTYVNSVIDGVISPERYSFAADQSEQGIRLSRWNISEAIAAYKKFYDAGRTVQFVTARVSPKIVDQLDFYAYIKEFTDMCEIEDYSKLCLEFPRTVLFEDMEKVRAAILALKLLKIKSMISGFGEKDSAVTPLFDIPFDYVILAPSLAYRITDRGKKAAMESFLSFIRLLGCDVIAENVKNDSQITGFLRSDCVGYIPSPDYQGSAEHGRLRMPLDEALLQSDDVGEGL